MKQILVTVSQVASQVINHTIFWVHLDACVVISSNIFNSFPKITNFIILMVNIFMVTEKAQDKNG